MADRRPLVSIAGRTKQLPIGDTISWNWLSNVPANLVSWASIAPSAKQDALGYTPVNKAGDTMTGQLHQNTTYSLYGYGGNAGSEQGFFGGWGNVGLWRQWPSAADHSTFIEAELSYATGLKVQHNGTYIFDLSASGNLRVPQVSVGSDTDILLYEGATNQLNVRVGPASDYKYFGFNTDGSFYANMLRAGANGAECVRVGDDASLWDVNAQHILGVKSQSDPNRGGIKFGDGPVIQRQSTTMLDLDGGLQSSGGEAYLGFQDRGGTAYWGWYSQGGVARLYHNGGSGDQLWTSNKDLYVGRNIETGAAGAGGNLTVRGQTYARGWLRTQNSGEGWYHEVHGGGWFMDNNTWIKAYNGKGVLSHGTIQGNRVKATLGGLHALSANSQAWIRVPRTFVQSSDPGAFASDGDLWFW